MDRPGFRCGLRDPGKIASHQEFAVSCSRWKPEPEKVVRIPSKTVTKIGALGANEAGHRGVGPSRRNRHITGKSIDKNLRLFSQWNVVRGDDLER